MRLRLFLPNMEFEHRLGPRPIQAINRRLSRLNAEYAASLLLIGRDGDRIELPEPVPDAFFDSMADLGLPRLARDRADGQQELDGVELVPWGWAPDVLQRFPSIPRGTHPEFEVVERVNSRRFSFAIEQEHGCSLTGSAQVGSLDELAGAIQSLGEHSAWVVKAEFGMSARERFLGRGSSVCDELLNWARKRLRGGQLLFIEPWVNIAAEYGVQFEISRSGKVQFLGITGLVTDDKGRYRGNVAHFAQDAPACHRYGLDSDLVQLIEACTDAAHKVAAAGYFGPLGIDAAQVYDPFKGLTSRPIQDINARFTMGRMCLGFQPLLQPGEQVRWIHTSRDTLHQRDDARHVLLERQPQARLILPTTPDDVGGKPTRLTTWAIIEPALPLQSQTYPTEP